MTTCVGSASANLPLRNEIDRYYVPLYVVSPLLTKSESFGGLCSHLDIAPTLTQLLEGNYKSKLPSTVSYVGQGLDTAQVFSATNIFPLNVYSGTNGNYIYKNILLAGEVKYKLGDGLTMATDNSSEIDIVKLKQTYIRLDKYVCNLNKILK